MKLEFTFEHPVLWRCVVE